MANGLDTTLNATAVLHPILIPCSLTSKYRAPLQEPFIPSTTRLALGRMGSVCPLTGKFTTALIRTRPRRTWDGARHSAHTSSTSASISSDHRVQLRGPPPAD